MTTAFEHHAAALVGFWGFAWPLFEGLAALVLPLLVFALVFCFAAMLVLFVRR